MNAMKALRQYQTVNTHAQTSEASPHRLVQMLMEGGLQRLAQAKGAMSRGQIAEKGTLLGKAVAIVTGLRDGLNLEQEGIDITHLDNLYDYMIKRLTEANRANDPEMIDEVARLLITVKSGWDAIATE